VDHDGIGNVLNATTGGFRAMPEFHFLAGSERFIEHADTVEHVTLQGNVASLGVVRRDLQALAVSQSARTDERSEQKPDALID
jgi:hypothetical protein